MSGKAAGRGKEQKDLTLSSITATITPDHQLIAKGAD
jgi:hypothetical protein